MHSSLAAPSLLVALFALGCGGAEPVCRTGRTSVDGVCADERVADYVACLRSNTPTLGEERALEVCAKFARTAPRDDADRPAPRVRHTGDRVSVLWQGKCYPARILRSSHGAYFITYEGYDHTWDETIDESRVCK